ncbi:MAG: metal-dependent hydrolase [Fluviicola sp. XM-24bin1]|nr:MAG: metal-dependent hydrolase [Fluviicola sp. XM-24bin1]
MDSLTQVVLGAAVGEAVLGKKIGNRAMVWGAVAGTIPDLDVYLRYFTDPMTATEMHRGFSHSIIFSVLMAAILGYCVWKQARISLIAFLTILAVYPILRGSSLTFIIISLGLLGLLGFLIWRRGESELKATQWEWSKLFYWTLVTHPLLDAHTTWGTQLFWPFEYRVAYQNIFVVDPLYTLPFLVFTLIALFMKRTNPKRAKFNRIGLIVSSSYMVLSIVLKAVTFNSFEKQLEIDKISYVEMDTRPAPLNTFLWNAQVETKTGYRMAYYSIFDSQPIQFSEEFPKNHHLLEPYKDQKAVKQLIKISQGWYMVREEDGKLYYIDLRFGQLGFDPDESDFIWKFELVPDENGQLEIERLQPDLQKAGDIRTIMKSLWQRMLGN